MTDYKEIYGKMERINTKSNDFMSFNNKVRNVDLCSKIGII